MSPVFLDIVAVFALFRRSVLNLYTTVLPLFYRAHPHYHFLVLTIARILFSYSLVKDRRLVTVGFCIW